MSTSAIHPTADASWKQEVNRRLAEHRERKPAIQPETQAPTAAQQNASRRAQEAAARVAARYAKAPSYSEVLATEARAAIRAAEAASEAALQAKAAAESVLANIEAASSAIPALISTTAGPVPVVPVVIESAEVLPQISPRQKTIAEPTRKQVMEPRANEGQPLTIRWATELPARSVPAAADLHEGQGHNFFGEEWWKPASAELAPESGEIDMVDPAQPIHGNLIEFPRELVAARKIRPRLAESQSADSAQMQLSIFEVDPHTVATEPSADAVQAAVAEWSQPAWSGIQFTAQPLVEEYEELEDEPAVVTQATHLLHTASFDRRVMAIFVDGSIIAGGMVAAAAYILNKAATLPSVRSMEEITLLALLIVSALYITLFYAIAPVTPGMKYARIRFCTFDGLTPTSAQRWNRLGAMLLSVLPVGLGLAWSLFDDDNLSWHDRLSKTYLCDN